MKVFISWSGERSEAVAKSLREWFPLVLHYVDPWLSQSDIQAGDRWSIEVAKKLENCNFGVLCVTRQNLNSPWILFEAGALAKSMEDGRVIPLLLDIDFKEVSGPLAQFQAKKVEQTGIWELISSLNKAAENPIPEPQLTKLFSALWGDLEKQISSIPVATTPQKQSRPQGEILEELVAGVRNVEMRVRDVFDEELIYRKRRRSRIHPPIALEMMHRVAESPRDPVRILIFASLFKEDAPWVYELGMEAYKAAKSGFRPKFDHLVRRFIDSVDVLYRSGLSEELGFDRGFLKMIRSEFFESMKFMLIDSAEEVNSQNLKDHTAAEKLPGAQ
jgi:hypothetical protein